LAARLKSLPRGWPSIKLKIVVEVCEKIKSFDEEIKVSTKGINDTKAHKEGVEKRHADALKVVAQIELDLKDIKDRI
jgi:structural maintenance of chromosome 3 (chondroitin sulfate proteoglycan 6)